MRIGWAVKLGAVSALAIAFAVAAATGSALIVRTPNDHYLSIAVRQGISPASVPGSIAAARASQNAAGFSTADNLNYHGGAVVHSVAPYLIFWIPSGDNTLSNLSQSLMQRYFTDLAADSGGSANVFGVDRQFTDTSGFADYKQTFPGSQVIPDSQPYPTKDAGNCVNHGLTSTDACVTDTQIQAEVQRLIRAGALPEDGNSSSSLPANAPLYFVVFPPDVNTCFSPVECSDGGAHAYCAYHSSLVDGSTGNNVLYANIPTYFASASPKGCQADGNAQVQEPNGDQVADVAAKYISHEFSETITDPVFTGGCGGGCGWWNSINGQEDGDQCNSFGAYDPANDVNPNAFAPPLGGSPAGTLFNQLVNGHEYYTQSEWSNGNGNCELRPSNGTITAGLTPPSGATPVGTPVTFTPTGSSANGYSSVTVDHGDGTTSFDRSGIAPAAMSHTYSHAGLYTATITAVDLVGNIAQGTSAQFAVGSPAAANFTFSPSRFANGVKVSFNGSSSTDPDSGVTLTSFTYNFGDGSTGTGANATHTYSKPGTYNVTLAVVNSLGLMSITSHSITVAQAKISKLKVRHKTSKGATVLVTVNAPGKLSGVGKTKSVSGPGTYKLKFKLSKARQQKLASTGHLTVKLKVKFTPLAGKTFTQKAKLKF